jgi:hypothetical protein
MFMHMYKRNVLALYVFGIAACFLGIGLAIREIGSIWISWGTMTIDITWLRAVVYFLFVSLIVGGSVTVGRALGFSMHPESHPVFQSLTGFSSPYQLAQSIDGELQETPEVVRFGKPIRSFRLAKSKSPLVFISRSWVVQPLPYTVRAVRISDVVWIRKRMHRTRHTDVEIRTRTTAVLFDSLCEADVQRMVRILVERLPWVFLSGFESDLEENWNSDREGFIRMVKQDQEAYAVLSPEAQRRVMDDKIKRYFLGWEIKGDASNIQ